VAAAADPAHAGLRDCVRELNQMYAGKPQFYGSDCDHAGFRWIDSNSADDSVWAFQRLPIGGDPGAPITCLFNATPVPRNGYRIGVRDQGTYRKIFDSDARASAARATTASMTSAPTAPACTAIPAR